MPEPTRSDGNPAPNPRRLSQQPPSVDPLTGATRTDQGVVPPTPPPGDVYGATRADAAAAPPGPVGRSARESYQVVRLIGQGGMGTVSLAKDVNLNRWVA